MNIIIAPAKRMRNDIAYCDARNRPQCLRQTRCLLKQMKTYTPKELQVVLSCNEKIAKQAYEAYQTMNLTKGVVPALLSYDGIQYTYMAPQVFPDEYYDYVEEHLRILSGFYGILRPFDGVVPYRLELQDGITLDGYQDLYEFWGDRAYRALVSEDREILDLASAQYSKLIKRYRQPKDRIVRCSFVEEEQGKRREKGVYVKMARGEMVRYLAEINATSLEDAKGFTRLGYRFDESKSTLREFVFVRTREKVARI